jgi:hypothetical protein
MSAIKDGGPAFPRIKQHWNNHIENIDGGLTMRDWFAGQALSAMTADLQRGQEYGTAMHELASKAYVIADAMLKAREVQS